MAPCESGWMADKGFRLVTWNACRGKAETKLPQLLAAYDPDLAAVQEISTLPPGFSGSWLWKGAAQGQKNQGVLLWAKPPLELRPITFFGCPTELYEAAQVWREDRHLFDAVCIWVKPAKRVWPGPDDYDASLDAAFEHTAEVLTRGTYVMLGDFNRAPYTEEPQFLRERSMVSAYHKFFRERPQSETHSTHRHNLKKNEFHVDWCLVPTGWGDKLLSVQVGALGDWPGDHVPLMVEVAGKAIDNTARRLSSPNPGNPTRAPRRSAQFDFVAEMRRVAKDAAETFEPEGSGVHKLW